MTPRDDAWFESLFRAHSTALYRYFVRRGPRDDAEDLAAEVLAVAWRRRDTVPDDAALPWLYRTAGFVLANHRRKGRPVPVGDAPDEVDDADPADLALADEEVRAVLAALSPRDRRILLLNAWEGLTGARSRTCSGCPGAGPTRRCPGRAPGCARPGPTASPPDLAPVCVRSGVSGAARRPRKDPVGRDTDGAEPDLLTRGVRHVPPSAPVTTPTSPSTGCAPPTPRPACRPTGRRWTPRSAPASATRGRTPLPAAAAVLRARAPTRSPPAATGAARTAGSPSRR